MALDSVLYLCIWIHCSSVYGDKVAWLHSGVLPIRFYPIIKKIAIKVPHETKPLCDIFVAKTYCDTWLWCSYVYLAYNYTIIMVNSNYLLSWQLKIERVTKLLAKFSKLGDVAESHAKKKRKWIVTSTLNETFYRMF